MQRPPTSTDNPADLAQGPIDQRLVWVMALACCLSVANLYYIQPILGDIARQFQVRPSEVGFVATLCQVGYAVGLLFIVPLGDSVDRRKLAVFMLGAVTVALLGAALSPTITVLAVAMFSVGATTIVPQVIVPFAAKLAAPNERGYVIGRVMSGLLTGVLLGRVVSGFLSTYVGWRVIYLGAAVLMVALAVVLHFVLPRDPPHNTLTYGQLLRSLPGLLRAEPVLRETSAFTALTFGAFSAFWITLALFLETPPYHYGSKVAGMFGLVGLGGASAVSFVGKLADRMNPRRMTGFALTLTFIAFVVFWAMGHLLVGLVIGVILLDVGAQAAHISNQTRVYALNPGARNRLNTVYMVSQFIGGSVGSALATWGWTAVGWNGVCAVGGGLMIMALAVYFRRR